MEKQLNKRNKNAHIHYAFGGIDASAVVCKLNMPS